MTNTFYELTHKTYDKLYEYKTLYHQEGDDYTVVATFPIFDSEPDVFPGLAESIVALRLQAANLIWRAGTYNDWVILWDTFVCDQSRTEDGKVAFTISVAAKFSNPVEDKK
jgi:hypothetical protein